MKAKDPRPKTVSFMEIVSGRGQMASVARKVRGKGQTIGLVPTMGALHEGHLSLVHKARAMCDVVVVSVFVNPTQFGPAEDFRSYPRDLTRDTSLLEHDVDYVFAPAVEEIYPAGYSSYVAVEGLSEQLEGESRPGHFRGVATVVAILLNTVNPDFAFFGQKDAQQVALIKKMVRDLGFGAEIVVLPIVREESGLAMSSRNAYLSEDEKRAAKVLSVGLARAAGAYDEGERRAERLIEIVRSTIEAEPLVRIDYVKMNDAESLEKVEKIDERPALLSLAAFIGKTRLIDNAVLGVSPRSAAIA